MTVKEIADRYINSLRTKYTAISDKDIEDINEMNYGSVLLKSRKLKEDLDSIIIRKDYTDVDNLYKSIYSNKLADEHQKIKDEMIRLRAESKRKYDALNAPIREKWQSIVAHYNLVNNIHSRLVPYRGLFRLYNKVFKKKLKPVEEVDIDTMSRRTASIEGFINTLSNFKKIYELPDFALNIIVIASIALLIFKPTSIIILLLLFAFITALIILCVVLSNEEDLISFTLQSIEEPNNENFKEIGYDDKAFEEFGVRTAELAAMSTAKEIIELEAKSKGVGSEEWEREYDKYIDEYIEEYNNQVKLQIRLEEAVTNYIANLKDSVHQLGNRTRSEFDMSYNFAYGMGEADITETFINVQGKAILIDNKDDFKKKQYLLLTALNMLSNVRFINVQVLYYDLIERGSLFISNKELEPITTVYTSMDDILKYLDTYMSETIPKINKVTKDFDEYNRNANSSKNLQQSYTLAVFECLDNKEGESEVLNEKFLQRLRTMITCGVIPVIVCSSASKRKLPIESVVLDVPADKLYKSAEERFDAYSNYLDEERVEQDSKGKQKRYTLRDELMKPPVFFEEDLLDDLVPEEKRWNTLTNNPDKGLEWIVGYYNGDKSQPLVLNFGDNGDVHGMFAGGTGSGKSFSAGAWIEGFCETYSPWDLRLWLADFKKVTFNAYLPTKEGVCLPHVDACICTTDPTYAASFFEGYVKMMNERQFLFRHNEANIPFEKIKDWNSYWLDKALETNDMTLLNKRLPRTLLLIDELAAVMEQVDGDVKKRILSSLKLIGTLGRAMGNHMLLSSQTLEVLPNDIQSQCTMRVCLRVQDKAVSQALLGTDEAFKITQKFGLGYTTGLTNRNTKGKTAKTALAGYKIKPVDLAKKLYDKAKDRGYKFKDIITYDEEIPVEWEELERNNQQLTEYVKENNIDDTGLFIYGKLMEYKPEQRLPYNRIYSLTSNASIMALFKNNDDLFNFYCLFKYNVAKSGYKFMMNTQAGDTVNTFLKLDEENVNKEILHMDFRTFIDQMDKLADTKIQSGSKTQSWILCVGWDKEPLFGISPNDFDLNQKIVRLLNKCSQVGMHFCFLCTTSAAKIKPDIVAGCSTTISSLIDMDSSTTLFGKSIGTVSSGDLKDNYMVIKDGMEITRARMYTSKAERGFEIKRGIVV